MYTPFTPQIKHNSTLVQWVSTQQAAKLSKKSLFQTAVVVVMFCLQNFSMVMHKRSVIGPQRTKKQLEHLNSSLQQKQSCTKTNRALILPLLSLVSVGLTPLTPVSLALLMNARKGVCSGMGSNYCWWPLPASITQSVCRRDPRTFHFNESSEAFNMEAN